MAAEVELKLSPKHRPDEDEVRKESTYALRIKQCYIAGNGEHAPACIRIKKIGKKRYLVIRDPAKKKGGKDKRTWRARLSRTAWKRLREGKTVLRVRRSRVIKGKREGDVFYEVAIKEEHDGDAKRHEWERPIPRWAYRLLWSFGTRDGTRRRTVRKTRYFVREHGRLMHIDFFRRRLRGLVLFEVEFKRRRGAERYRARHGKAHGNVFTFKHELPFITGRSRDVTHCRAAGCRTLSRRKDAPAFW